jgi:hypothetical protein
VKDRKSTKFIENLRKTKFTKCPNIENHNDGQIQPRYQWYQKYLRGHLMRTLKNIYSSERAARMQQPSISVRNDIFRIPEGTANTWFQNRAEPIVSSQ